jgi:hypothetical protein
VELHKQRTKPTRLCTPLAMAWYFASALDREMM